MGWIPGAKEGGEVENLLPDYFVTDACCSWRRLAFLTSEGECVLWSDYTNEQSHPRKVEVGNRKFKAAGCLESSCILLSGKFYFTLRISRIRIILWNTWKHTYCTEIRLSSIQCFLLILSYLVKCLPVYITVDFAMHDFNPLLQNNCICLYQLTNIL